MHMGRFARRTHSRRAKAVEVPVFGWMKSSANSGSRLDASETTFYLFRTRQRLSTISNERRYWLTQHLQH